MAPRAGDDVIAIPGTTRIENLKDNIGALQVALMQAELEEVSALISTGAAAGLRYPAAQIGSVYI